MKSAITVEIAANSADAMQKSAKGNYDLVITGLQIGSIIAFSIITETVFQWPGTGSLFLEAITRVDTPLITAYVIFVGLVFVVTNTLVDLLYGLINPTVKLTSKGG